eukprot:m.259477 g.259477  ORF g.259477 m.259477 type:complete len:655 (-) comp38118_c0_seq1:43-2007(-)
MAQEQPEPPAIDPIEAAPALPGTTEEEEPPCEHKKRFEELLQEKIAKKATNHMMLSQKEYQDRIDHLLKWEGVPLQDRNYNWSNTFEVMEIGQDTVLVKRPKPGENRINLGEALIYTHTGRIFEDLQFVVDDDETRSSQVYKSASAKFANVSREITQMYVKSRPTNAAKSTRQENPKPWLTGPYRVVSNLPPFRKRKNTDDADHANDFQKRATLSLQPQEQYLPPPPEITAATNNLPAYQIRDIRLANQGHEKIKLAERNMQALVKLRNRYRAEQPFKGLRISVNLHVTKETAVLVHTLQVGGASLAVTGCNSMSTQDDVAAALVTKGVKCHCMHGCTQTQYFTFVKAMVDFKPNLIIDDGADLCMEMHNAPPEVLEKFLGGCEQTTSGVIRVKNMAKQGAIKFPVITTNDNKTKHLLDNYYGTGQSVWDGIMRATSLFIAGKVAVCVGYGECGKGIALRAKGLGAIVIVTEVDAFAALRATYDGFQVMPIANATKLGDFFVTATANKYAIDVKTVKAMKDGVVLANAGQFDYEIDVKGLHKIARGRAIVRDNMEQITMPSGKSVFVLGGGNLVNLSCAEGHPSEVMATSFLGQALACEYLVKEQGKLPHGPVALPEEQDNRIAEMQLEAIGIKKDELTPEQTLYMQGYSEGTN